MTASEVTQIKCLLLEYQHIASYTEPREEYSSKRKSQLTKELRESIAVIENEKTKG